MSVELQRLVDEFFEAPGADAGRKKDIEAQLALFKQRPDALSVCRQLLSEPRGASAYTQWFCLSVFEDLLPRWSTRQPSTDRQAVKAFLWSLLSSTDHQSSYASFVQTKLATLVVQIARQELPSGWPTYFDDILAVQTSNPLLCLTLVRLTVEEFTAPRDSDALSAARLPELRSLIESRCFEFCSLASQILDHVYESEIMRPDRPFAPSRDPSSALISPGFGIDMFSPLGQVTEIASSPSTHLGVSPSKGISPDVTPILASRPASSESSQALPIVHRGRISSPSTALCKAALDVFHHLFAWIPLDSPALTQRFVATLLRFAQLSDDSVCDLGAQSLACLNEIMSRKYSPSGHSEFVALLMMHISELLRYLTQTQDPHAGCLLVESLNEDQKLDARGSAQYLSKYQGGIVGLVGSLCERLQAPPSDWTPSETSDARKTTLDFMAKAAELYPSDVLQLAFDIMVTNTGALRQSHAQGDMASSTHEKQCTTIELSLLLFGRISHLFTRSFEPTFAASSAVVDHCCSLGESLFERAQQSRRLVRLLATVINVLGLYAHWLSLFRQAAQSNAEALQSFELAVSRISLIACQALNLPDNGLRLAAARLLRSLAETVRPDLLRLPHVVQLLSSIHQDALAYDSDTKDALYRFATALFVLPPLNSKTSDEEWSSRSSMFRQLMQPLVDAYLGLLQSAELTAVLSTPEGTLPKEIVYGALAPTLQPLVSLLKACGDNDDLLCVLLDHATLLFSSLRAQLSRQNPEMLSETIHLFMAMLKGDALVAHLQRDSGSAVVERSIGFLSAAIDHPVKGNSQLLPGIIAFCVHDLYPRCISGSEKAFDGIRPLFFGMLYRLMLNHWRYFFNTRIGAQSGGSASEAKNEAEFAALIQMFVLPFRGPHVEIIKQNMSSLIQLDDKCRLFHKTYFVETLAAPIVELVVDMLLQRTHDFLREDMIDFVSRIATADVQLVPSKIMPMFLSKRCSQFGKEQQEALASRWLAIKDVETAKESIQTLMREYSVYESVMRAS
ncbi:hypothetical protein HK105_204511 [Polyrhizophydium stewartii]|uniref:Exportin-1/Importin-beta-like domain-containing protein n=1 Tax=Polyrhizophydium stewartii TaxID=2732419 RepID=A0ABR4N973_9FUNG